MMNSEQGTQTQHHLEHLLDLIFEGTEFPGPWVQDRATLLEMGDLGVHEALEMGGPLSVPPVHHRSDEARRAVRQAAQEIRTAASQLQWAKLIALKEAPFPVGIPPNCDTRDPDVIAVMIRDIVHDGSCEKAIAWLQTEDSEEQRQVDFPRTLQLAAFERAYGVNLDDFLFSQEARAEHEQMTELFRWGGLTDLPLHPKGN